MNCEKISRIYESYFGLQDLLRFEEIASLPFVRGQVVLHRDHASQLAAELNRLGVEAGLDGTLLQEKVAKRISDLKKLKTPDVDAPNAAATARKRQTKRIQNLTCPVFLSHS